MKVSLLRKALLWLDRPAVPDALDRRSASGLQVVVLLAALLVPVAVVSGLLEHREPSTGAAAGIAASIGLWLCFWLLRRGNFRTSVVLLYSGLLALILASYQSYGLRAHAGFQVAHLLPLLLGGLLLGRSALWWGLGVLLAALVIGAGVDLAGGEQPGAASTEVRAGLMASALTFLVASVMLDRLISASRRALRRSEELYLVNARLAREMEERERTQIQLLHAQKLDAIGQLARGIAHDFNNILGVIVGYADLARSRDGYDGKPIAGIENAARRGALMTRRLLGLGRRQSRQTQRFDAVMAVEHAMTLIDPLFRGRCETRISLPSQPLWVELDRSEFELALLNLATNSRDAMPAGGGFSLTLDAQEDEVRLTVADTGHGMTPEVIARVFEPFFTTKPGDRGSGIGMAIVERLVADAGGRIMIDSAPGAGTAITLHLPRAAPPVADVPSNGASARVVLVEDDPELQTILCDALTAAGLEVASAACGAEARAISQALDPQALVLDYRLPDVDCNVLMDELAARWPQAARFLITSHLPAELHETTIEDIEVLHKPFPPHWLADRIRARVCAVSGADARTRVP